MSNKRWFMPFLLLLVLVLAACGGAAAEPTPAPAPTTATTGQGGDDGGDDVAEEPEATEEPADVEPTEEPAEEPTEEPAEEPTEEPAEEPTAEAGDDDSANLPGGSTSIDDAEDINSYRFSAEITASGEAFEADEDMAMFGDGITIEGAFIKEPPASDVMLEIPGFGELGFREVDGNAYANFGGSWIESTPEEALNVDDLAPITADDLGDDLDRMENLGEEEVNGRDTTHYRADKELLQEIAEENDEGDASFNFNDADEANLDVWLDDQYGFVVKMELVAEGAGLNEDVPDASGRVEFLIDYYDFNADDIEIEVPELTDLGDTGDSGDDSGDTGDTGDDSGDTGDTSMEATDIPGLLGFDMELPEGSEAEVSFGTATLTIPAPMEEAQAIIQEAFEANGYELDPDLSAPDMGILWYANGEQEWYITLTETDGVTEVFIF
jgi:hypothetical protein